MSECPHEVEFAEKLATVDSRSKSNTKRLDDIEHRQDELDKLVASVSALANEQTHIKEDVQTIKADVKTLTSLPGKRWNNMVDKIIWAVLAALISFLLGRMGV